MRFISFRLTFWPTKKYPIVTIYSIHKDSFILKSAFKETLHKFISPPPVWGKVINAKLLKITDPGDELDKMAFLSIGIPSTRVDQCIARLLLLGKDDSGKTVESANSFEKMILSCLAFICGEAKMPTI